MSPRSDYIYVILRNNDPIPVAAFTVKHELATWLYRNLHGYPGPDLEDFTGWRMRDGQAVVCSTLDLAELREQGRKMAEARANRTHVTPGWQSE